MPINLNNVNISIREFQSVASGDHNAGEVKLTSETTLDRVNHHVSWRILNRTSLPHEEVLAIKNAFVRALRDGVCRTPPASQASTGISRASTAPRRKGARH